MRWRRNYGIRFGCGVCRRFTHRSQRWRSGVRIVPRLALVVLAALTASAQQQPNGLYAVFKTSLGNFTARLYEKDTPNTVATFVGLANGTQPTLDPKTHKPVKVRLYDNITFHRVVPGEMIQS